MTSAALKALTIPTPNGRNNPLQNPKGDLIMRKTFLFVFTIIAAVCLSIGITGLGGTSVVKAETVAGITPTFSATKYLKSTDGKYMLLATGIKDRDDCYEVGYELEGLKASVFNTGVFYTSISINGEEKSWTTEDLFPEYEGMIVWEVECDAYLDPSFKAYAKVGERIDGELFSTDEVVNNTQKELAMDRTDAVSAPNADSKYLPLDGNQTVENWHSSSKMLVFDYKWTDDNGDGNDYVLIQLLNGSNNVLSSTFRLNYSNNQLCPDNSTSTFLGRTIALKDGWRQFRVRLCDLPLKDGADGTETLTKLKVAKSHRYDMLIDNIRVEDIKDVDTNITLGGSYSVTSGYEIYLPDYDQNIINTLEFDLELVDYDAKGNDIRLFDTANAALGGQYRFYGAAFYTGNTNFDGAYILEKDSTHYHVVFDLNEINGGNGGKVGKIADYKTAGAATITNVRLSADLASIDVDSTFEKIYFSPADVDSGKILSFDLSVPSNADIRYNLADNAGNYFGTYRFYAPYKDGHTHGSGLYEDAIKTSGFNSTGVTYTEIGANLYHLEYDLSALSGVSEEAPTTIYAIYNNGTKNYTDGLNKITNIKWLESTKYTVTVTNGSGSGTYHGGESVTVTTKVPYGKAFAGWTVGGEVVSTDNPYTFTVTEDITLTAAFEDGETKVMLSSGYEIDLPDYDENEALTLEFDVCAASSSARISIVLTDENGVSTSTSKPYRISSAGVQTSYNAEGISQIKESNYLHIVFNLSELTNGSETSLGKIVKMTDGSASVSLDGSWIDNIAFYGEKANYTVTVVGGTGGGTYQDGANATVIATIPDDKNFVEWQIGGEKVSDSAEYTFKVTGDVTITAVFEDKAAGDTKVMLTSGFSIDLPDYDAANATTLEFDVCVTAARSPYAKIYWNLYDASNNYFGYYRVTHAGKQAANASGYSVTTISSDNVIHVTLVLSELAGGSGTPGKLVRIADNGFSVNLTGCWIDNIEIK